MLSVSLFYYLPIFSGRAIAIAIPIALFIGSTLGAALGVVIIKILYAYYSKEKQRKISSSVVQGGTLKPLSGQEHDLLAADETRAENIGPTLEPGEELEYNVAYEKFQYKAAKPKPVSSDYEMMEDVNEVLNVAGPLQ